MLLNLFAAQIWMRVVEGAADAGTDDIKAFGVLAALALQGVHSLVEHRLH